MLTKIAMNKILTPKEYVARELETRKVELEEHTR